MRHLIVLILLLKTSILLSQKSCSQYNVIYSWKNNLPVNWNSNFVNANYDISSKRSPIGIKAYKDKIIINIPRWGNRYHPVNIAWLPNVKDPCPVGPLENVPVNPYPNWEMQRIGDCSAFQFVQSFEVEPDSGWMWLPDSGLPGVNCPPKIIVLNADNGRVIRQHNIPSNVARTSSNFLNDIALDISNPDDKFAFISDSKGGKIIVYSFKNDRSWAAEHWTMKANLNAKKFEFLVPSRRTLQITDNHVNGIAVSPASKGSKRLYFSPLVSFDVYSIPTSVLKSPRQSRNIRDEDINVISDLIKTGQNDGMTVDQNGYLYTAEITKNTIIRWNVDGKTPSVLVQDNTTLIWGDTLGIDSDGYLLVTTRGWPVDSHNRIVRYRIGAKSYLSKN